MKTGSSVIHELLWSFFLFLLLPVELRGLVGAAPGTGQGRVLLPWLLKPEVAVEEGEKPPLTRAERRHSAAHTKRPGTIRAKHVKRDGAVAGKNAVKSVAAKEKAPSMVPCQQQCCHK